MCEEVRSRERVRRTVAVFRYVRSTYAQLLWFSTLVNGEGASGSEGLATSRSCLPPTRRGRSTQHVRRKNLHSSQTSPISFFYHHLTSLLVHPLHSSTIPIIYSPYMYYFRPTAILSRVLYCACVSYLAPCVQARCDEYTPETRSP